MHKDLKCLRCGAPGLEEGFTFGKNSGDNKWVEGRLERGALGGPRVFGKKKLPLHAYRCPECDHVEFFTGEDDQWW